MKLKSTFKNLATLLVLIITSSVFAQDAFQGQATYMSKTTMDMDNFGGRELSPERKKMIMERMKTMLEKTFILDFNKSESTYKEDEALEAPGGGGRGFMMGGMAAGTIYKDVKENVLLHDQEFFGKQFLINDSLVKLDWKMSGESKQIGKYTAFKATATKKVDAADWTNMRRRGNDGDKKKDDNKEVAEVKKDSTKTDAPKDPFDDIEIPEEIEVTAWYTMDIPVNSGPGEYWGLPGLILEVNAGRTTILCSKIVMNPSDKNEIKKPTKGKEVTMEEYQDIVKKKMEEMREMFRSRGGRGRN
ncbi:GLPGLI family protein [Olleya sp. UBA1516]|uniref:GLPGLI family protein n=1 Tax=Olleya sp. UBA1516 TaxID=1947013 RepID=UPI0025CC5240|nr:GLPGLI family protein [Olleya sp. UBA1516]|tara:strand:- start:1498 stop:2403 length:906 start_codon:yes stop_codon:yes gene_type:complete